jgi:pre-rRNA-processing protein TSR1
MEFRDEVDTPLD